MNYRQMFVDELRKAVHNYMEQDVLRGTLGWLEDGEKQMHPPGLPGHLYVSKGEQGPVIARNDAGVPHSHDLPVKMRMEGFNHVIIGVDKSWAAALVNLPDLPSGVPAHTHAGGGGGNPFEWLQVITPDPLPDDPILGYPAAAIRIETLDDSQLYLTVEELGEPQVAWGRGGLFLNDIDTGNDGLGNSISIGRNWHTGGESPARLSLQAKNGVWWHDWHDSSGILRTSTFEPVGSTDTSGTVVGTQTSSLDSKTLLGPPVTPAEALIYVMEAARQAIRRFTYKSGAYQGEEFSGIVTDYAPRYGMDADADHPHGKSLNVINAIGDLMLAVTELNQRLERMEARLTAAER